MKDLRQANERLKLLLADLNLENLKLKRALTPTDRMI
jgi:hypothetical protein